MRCDQCRYWGVFDTSKSLNADLGYEYGDLARCAKAEQYAKAVELYENRLKPEFDHVKMFVLDVEKLEAALITRADFFCAHFSRIDSDILIKSHTLAVSLAADGSESKVARAIATTIQEIVDSRLAGTGGNADRSDRAIGQMVDTKNADTK